MNRENIASPIYVHFKDGVCYGFVAGSTVDATSVRDCKISQLIAEQMANFHSVPFQNLSNADGSLVLNMSPDGHNLFLWRKLYLFLEIAEKECIDKLTKNPKFATIFGSLAEVRAKVEHLENHINQLLKNSSVKGLIGFCHNDLLLNNILYDSKTDNLRFIDFEYADFNYAPFDIANHFVEYAGVDDVDFNRYPSKEYQLNWIRHYLECRYNKLQLGKVSDSDVETWFILVQKFALASYLMWTVWGFVQYQYSELDFDFFE